MPKIPFIGEGQVLQAGNPVPVGSSEVARAQGENIQAFGKAAENAMVTYYKTQRAAKDMTNKVEYEEADTKAKQFFYNQAVKYQDHLKANENSDGTEAYNDFIEQNKSGLNDIAESTVSDPLNRRLFKAKAEEYSLAAAQQMGAEQRKRGLELKTKSINKSIGAEIENVRNLGPGLIEPVKAKVTNFIESLPDEALPRAQKDAYLANLPQRLHQTAIEGMYQARNFDGARNFIKQNAVNVGLSAEDITKQLDDVSNTENKMLSQDHQKVVWQREELKIQQETNSKKAMLSMLPELVNPATSPQRRAELVDKAEVMNVQGTLLENDFKLIQNRDTRVEKELSGQTRINYMDQIIDKAKPYDQLENEIVKATSPEVRTLTVEDAIPLLHEIRLAKERKKSERDPMIQAGVEYIKTQIGADAFAFGNEKIWAGQREGAAVLKFKNLVYNQKLSPDAALSIVTKDFNFTAAAIGSSNPLVPEALRDNPTAENFSKYKADTLDKYNRALKAGDKESARVFQQTLDQINRFEKGTKFEKRSDTANKKYAPPTTQPPPSKGFGESVRDFYNSLFKKGD